MLLAPLYDPLGKGIWIILLLCGLLGLGGGGFFPAARPFGFGVIAVLGVLFGAYVVKVHPTGWANGSVILFIPSLVSVALSIYCLVRPLR